MEREREPVKPSQFDLGALQAVADWQEWRMRETQKPAFHTSFWRVCRVLGGIFGIMMMLDALVGHSAPGVQWQEFVPGLLLLMAMVIFSRW